MKFCQKHWDMLRAAIKARGLAHLVSKDAEELVQVENQRKKGRSERYDPLMAAHNAIVNRALYEGGTYLLEDDFCPICEAIKSRAGVYDHDYGKAFTAEEEERYWIDGPSDMVLNDCKKKGLVISNSADYYKQ